MERCPLHQSFLSAECKTSRTKGRDRDRGTTPNRARRGNHLRLWAAVCGVLFGEWWLPLCSMPQTESSSSQESSPPQLDHIKIGVFIETRNVRFRSEGDIASNPRDVRFTPDELNSVVRGYVLNLTSRRAGPTP